VRAAELMHGKTSPIEHDGTGVFAGLASPITATRYHSLIVAEDGCTPWIGRVWWRTAMIVPSATRH